MQISVDRERSLGKNPRRRSSQSVLKFPDAGCTPPTPPFHVTHTFVHEMHTQNQRKESQRNPWKLHPAAAPIHDSWPIRCILLYIYIDYDNTGCIHYISLLLQEAPQSRRPLADCPRKDISVLHHNLRVDHSATASASAAATATAASALVSGSGTPLSKGYLYDARRFTH